MSPRGVHFIRTEGLVISQKVRGLRIILSEYFSSLPEFNAHWWCELETLGSYIMTLVLGVFIQTHSTLDLERPPTFVSVCVGRRSMYLCLELGVVCRRSARSSVLLRMSCDYNYIKCLLLFNPYNHVKLVAFPLKISMWLSIFFFC